ncbi:MAG TPA: outer membrane beta-barrel protein [Candidatus Sulfotelmatobacter sp.]|nr:outer membrane beta-barrel protein [Candidatus Sulfotelmatobacter sp.]
MQVAVVVLCAGAVAFLLRVLVALVKEGWTLPSPVVTVYLAKFTPSRRRGELILMKLDALKHQSATRMGGRTALVALIAAGFALPLLHGQQTAMGPSANEAASGDTAVSASHPQPSQEILQELDAMKKRIEQLEAQLKQRDGAAQPAAMADPAMAAAPATALPLMSAAATPPAGANALVSESAPTEKKPPAEPFAFADWSWLNGNPRTKEAAFDSKFFTPEIRADVDYTYDFNHPADDSIGGSSEIFRSNEVGLTQLGVGGDFHFDHVRARLMTQFGMYSTTTPRNDASYSRGQWNLADAYRYVSEAYGGYHWDALHGINVDAGIFMSYVGLFSYYNFDNWAYQPSYVSSNTPWFFTGMRIQIFPTEKLKIEPWIINGWQSYARFNGRIGLGGQVLYRPTSWISMLSNNYGVGSDALGIPNRTRMHTDNSIEIKYFDHPERFLDKMAFTLTGDAGCETGGGVNCLTNQKNPAGQIVSYKQSFLGYMLYNRWWFHKDRYGVTIGGGKINNPGRYLVLLPPIDGATATSGTPYFTENPGDPFKAWDISGTYDYMPSQYITFRWEFNHRHANVPYWTGPGGITPPGGNNGNPGSLITLPSGATWQPDLRKTEDRATMAILVKF